MFDEHPWKTVLDEVTSPRSRSTKQCLEQAKELLRRLGVHPVLPWDDRPADRLRNAMEEAKRARREKREARRALREAKKKLAADAETRVNGSDEAGVAWKA